MSFVTLRYGKIKSERRTNRRTRIPSSPASRSKRSTAVTSSPLGGNNGDGKQSIRLTMKVAPSKLREVMRANEVDSLRDTLGGGQVLDGPRSTRRATQARTTGRAPGRPKYVEPLESDLDEEEDEDEDEEEEDGDDDDAEAEEDATMNDFDEIGAEAEGGTDEEDVEMGDDSPAPPPPKKQNVPPKPPKITLKTPAKKNTTPKQPLKPTLIVTPADVGPVRSVEDEEMADDDSEEDEDEDEDEEDEEIDENSELPDNEETNLDEEDAEAEDDQDETNLNEEDAEGEDEELDDDDDDELGDSDDDEPASGTATPDPSKMTSRQRGRPVEPLLALDMAPQQRKFFTDEEKAMKKDEHARKRKELTKRKTQEEKTAALNRLVSYLKNTSFSSPFRLSP